MPIRVDVGLSDITAAFERGLITRDEARGLLGLHPATPAGATPLNVPTAGEVPAKIALEKPPKATIK